MYINESRRGSSGIGFLALQDHGWEQARGPEGTPVTLDQRVTIMGVRVKDRWRDTMPVGYYKYEEDTVGDIIGSNLWTSKQGTSDFVAPDEQKGRELHGWRFTPWPVKVVTEQSKFGGRKPYYPPEESPRGRTVAGPAIEIGGISGLSLLPVYDRGWLLDERFKDKELNPAPGLATPAVGTHGIVVSADKEGRQDDLFFSLDNRLIAVNFAGSPPMGSIVADLNDKSEIDNTRTARLQSAFRVIKTKEAEGCVDFLNNVIALQIGKSGQGDHVGGIAWDTSIGGVLGQALGSGPLTCGAIEDKHKIATDEDGNFINSAHISTNAYFFKDEFYDAPLKFDNRWEGAKNGPESFEVFLEYDEEILHPHVCDAFGDIQFNDKEGIWRWRSTATVGSSTTPPPPYPGPDDEPPPAIPDDRTYPPLPDTLPPFPPWPEQWKSKGGFVGNWPTIGGPALCGTGLIRMEKESRWGWAQTTLEMGAPTLNFQPMFQQDGRCDTSTWLDAPAEMVSHQKQHSPMVSRIESFGLQNAEDWTYFSQPGLCREPRYSNRGSAHGGLVFLPPQLTIADYVADRQASVSASTATFIIADSTRLGFGTPSVTEEGGLSEGFYHKYDPSTHYLELRREDDTRYMYMEQAGNNRVWIDQALGVNKCFSLGQTEVTISSNTITPTSSNMVVDEAGPYDYDTIYTIETSGVAEGQIVLLKPASGKTIHISEYYYGNIHGNASLTENDNVAGLLYTAGAWTIIFSKEG